MPEISNGSGQGGVNSTIPSNAQHNKKDTRRIFSIIAILILLITVPVLVAVSRHPQETRQHASGVTPTTIPFNISQYTSCGTSPVDIMLIIDSSDSMNQPAGSNTTKIQAAQAAAKSFIDSVASSSNNTAHIGLVTFDNSARVNSALTTNYTSIKTAIDNIKLALNTCTQCGIDTTNTEIKKDGRSGVPKVAILLTDGIANWLAGWPSNHGEDETQGQAGAITAVQNEFGTTKFPIYTVGLGNNIRASFLQQIASITGAKYYFSPTTDQLGQIYQTLSQIVGKGSISGTVFNDQNNNGTLDSGEPGLENWTVNLKDTTNTNLISTTKSASDGSYSFTGLCAQSYAVSEVLQSTWTQTSPPDPHYYSVNLSNGSNETGKDFGNVQAACGTSCKTDADCSQAGGGCTVCNTGTSKCSPQPSVCVTPNPIQNVQIICTDCGNQN